MESTYGMTHSFNDVTKRRASTIGLLLSYETYQVNLIKGCAVACAKALSIKLPLMLLPYDRDKYYHIISVRTTTILQIAVCAIPNLKE